MRRGVARRLGRAAAVGVALAAFLPMGGGVGAVEADATLRVEKQGWYWLSAQRVQAEPPVCPDPSTGVPCPNATQQPNPYEQDHLVVGRSGGQDQAWSVLQFSLGWLQPGTKITRAALILEESNDDATHRNRRPGGTVNPEGAALQACLVKDFWGPSQPGLWDEKPPVDCKVSGEGTRRETQFEGRTIPLWEFDLTPVAKVWGKDPFANYGVAIVPAGDAADDFQISLHGDTRVLNVDPVTRREESESLIRVRGTMRFVTTAPVLLEPDGDAAPTGTGDAPDLSAVPSFGAPDGGFDVDPAPLYGVTTPDVNRDVTVRGAGPSFRSGSAVVPGYMWIGLPVGLALTRLLMMLFAGGGPEVRANRVAAAYRRGRRISGPAIES